MTWQVKYDDLNERHKLLEGKYKEQQTKFNKQKVEKETEHL